MVFQINVDETENVIQIHGQGIEEEPRNLIEFNKSTGDVYILGPVDCEKYDTLKLTFVEHDKKTHNKVSQLSVHIYIVDVNDNPPLFEHQKYNITIEESTLQGTDLITVKATDHDSSEKYRKFTFSIHSVTPTPHDLEFFISNMPADFGRISFKGCLNYEKAEKYVLIVMATDDGKPKPLSSSCTVIINIEDGNNHLPEFIKQNAPEKVKEGQENVFVSRLQVADNDTRETRAWKAKYKIHGDKNNNFRITTDPETNEGLLYVEKHLDFEEDPVKNITITAENEIPYYMCKVKNRNAVGLWTIQTGNEIIFSGAKIRRHEDGTEKTSSYKMTVNVEDVSEPPVFDRPQKQISVPENVEAGQYLETFSARDPDISGTKVKYIKGEDPADCLTVDPETGDIKTSKSLDRESPFVKNGVYVATLYAVKDGERPLTGTATLSIQINDVNDNAPSLAVSSIDMCQSDETSQANITALDLDEEPYVGPFRFKLLEDVEDRWRVEPKQGYSVYLVKENKVYSGHHELLIEVSDLQGKTAVHKLSVTVCDCLNVTQPNCRNLKASRSTLEGASLRILFLCMTLFAGLLIVTLLVSCKYKKLQIPITIPADNSGHLIISNTEEPGDDCRVNIYMLKVPFELINNSENEEQMLISSQVVCMTTAPVPFELVNINNHGEQMQIRAQAVPVTTTPAITDTVGNFEAYSNGREYGKTSSGMTHSVTSMSQQWKISQGVTSSMGLNNQLGIHKTVDWMRQYHLKILLKRALEKTLDTLHAQGEELGDYEPAVYTEEGDEEHVNELDAISIPELSFDPDLNLDSRFFPLASVCLPDGITAQSTKNEYANSVKHAAEMWHLP
ncbi:B-cadherin-like [Kryptolebias marmoratus]|uniref:B-cadherin-like n=1 Tax=Kryptolebias marmoratus TaxID=37003 RepID=UPI0018ACDFA8|nr:B-cadherin-like [Kryptolebias marmoratus]